MCDLEEFEQHVRGFSRSELSSSELLANFALGLAGESGEVVDHLKKMLYHGVTADRNKLVLELGDVLWYLVALCQQLDITPSEAMQSNIDKLRERHKGTGFNRQASANSKGEQLVHQR